MKKLLVLIAGGIGYVLGTKAGRERYDQIRGTFNKVKDPASVEPTGLSRDDLVVDARPLDR